MPTINTYFRREEHVTQLEELTGSLKEFTAQGLSCKEISLGADEISVRLLHSLGRGMLADVEMDITAAPYLERVEKQDQICLDVRQFVLDHIPSLEDVKVWLNLHELGHSWGPKE